MPRLSAIIIALNEERDLPACLESLKGVADEIILVDGHSTDKTRDIARAHTDKVFENTWTGYGPQKQFALDRATGEWVLNVDADERISPDLAREIKSVLQANDASINAFDLPFHVHFLGSRLRFGGCFRESHVRLFRRDKARYTGQQIHEGIQVEPPIGRLNGAVLHESYKDFSEYLEKCNKYTGLIARGKHAAGKRFRAWQHLRLPWEFFVRYFVKLGFLDGNAGFVYAALSAYYAWLKHVRLIDMERGEG
ncbi:MAG: glycosyltransferase family 2 protein [Elusimicrobia bacterium]|nr:glycosyltransferase family 2 protein [Elusimicrobiota bacterium]